MCAVSAVPLVNAFQSLQNEIDKIVEVKTDTDEQAIVYAKALANISAAYRRELCTSPNDKFKSTLAKTEMRLPIALKAIKLLNLSELQFSDELKRELSVTTRIFFELILCQCLVQGRSLYKSDHEQLYATFKEMLKTLPEKEVLTGFELRCCRTALKNFASITDRAKKASKEGALALAGGVIQTITSARPTPPYVNPAPLLVGAVSAALAVYKQKKDLWYLKVFELKMLGFEVGLQTTSQYKMLSHNGKTVKERLGKHASDNANLAFYICQVFKEVIDNPNIEQELKAELFQGESISIVRLAEKRPVMDVRNKYWKVRYLALSYLEELIDKPEYNNEVSQKVIIRQLTRPFDKRILRKKAYQVCDRLLQKKCANLQQVMQEIFEESNAALEGVKPETQERIQAAVNAHKDEIKSLEAKLKFRPGLTEQSSEASTETKEELQKKLEEQKREYAEALYDEDLVNNALRRQLLLKEVLENENGGLEELLKKVAAESGGIDEFTSN